MGVPLKIASRVPTVALGVMALAAAGALATSQLACRRSSGSPSGAAAPKPPAPALTAASPRPAAPPPPRGKQITFMYSSNLLGEYEPCG